MNTKPIEMNRRCNLERHNLVVIQTKNTPIRIHMEVDGKVTIWLLGGTTVEWVLCKANLRGKNQRTLSRCKLLVVRALTSN